MKFYRANIARHGQPRPPSLSAQMSSREIDSNQLMTQAVSWKVESIQLMTQAVFQGTDLESTHVSSGSPDIDSD